MPNSIYASAFFDVTIYFPRDVYMLVTWLMARDEFRAENMGVEPKTTVWDVCEAVSFMAGVDAKEIEAKFRDAGIDVSAIVESDPDSSPILERIIQEEDDEWMDEDGEEFLGGEFDDDDFEDDFDDGDRTLFVPSKKKRKQVEPPESMTFELTASDRKLVLKHGHATGAMLAMLDQHTRSPQNIMLECDCDTYKLLLVSLTTAALKLQGTKYDELTNLISYMLQEAADQGLDLPI